MSWFKRTSSLREDGGGQVTVNGRHSPSPGIRGGAGGGGGVGVVVDGRDHADTDPDTCFEVFKNHWQQAVSVIGAGSKKGQCSNDDVETVVHNFEQMMTLLVGEEGIDGMPGPIVHFLLEKEVFETFCNWCSGQRDHQDKLCMEQLRMYELLISQSRQLLLIHKQVIRPLLRLLMACAETQFPNSTTGSEELAFRLVLVLHQICTCISQQTVILESFFTTQADHGPAKFLIFSLLIPYIHREGPVGQRARDALLLLMTLSAIHPHIGHYIADNSDFCPVLATGLSGLYSSLPRKITPPSEDWFALTEDDCQRIPDLQMFLNSLEFCNAVVQVAHPLVRDQLIKFIYSGFLVPVLGPALHQNSRDEVMTATAYLDLFLRRISEPHLIRAFLRFVLTERHDEILILESLITRINSNTKLSLVSLSLFYTLVDMNCEEVMFQLVFKYLIPCTHVMVSQRRAVRDLDLYGKSAEKFLSLRPVCCMTSYPTPSPSPSSSPSPQVTGSSPSPSPTPPPTAQGPSGTASPSSISRSPLAFSRGGRSASISSPDELTKAPVRQEPRRRSLFRLKKDKKKLDTVTEDGQRQPGEGSPSSVSSGDTTGASPTVDDNAAALQESCYADYLVQARLTLEQCARACRNWSAPYDGEFPPPDSNLDDANTSAVSLSSADSGSGGGGGGATSITDNAGVSVGSTNNASSSAGSLVVSQGSGACSSSKSGSGDDENDAGNKSVDGSMEGRQRSHSEMKLLSHGNLPPAQGQLPDGETLQVVASERHSRPSGASSSGGGASDVDPSHTALPSPASSVILSSTTTLGTPCNNNKDASLLSSSSYTSSSFSPSRGHLSHQDLAKLNTCLDDLDSFLSCLNELELPPPPSSSSMLSTSSSSHLPEDSSIEESLSELSSLITSLSVKRESAEVSSRKARSRNASFNEQEKREESSSSMESQLSSSISRSAPVMSTTKVPAFSSSSSSQRKHPAPSAGLGLRDVSMGATTTSRPLPAAVRYSNSPPNIGPFLAAVFSRLEGMVGNSLYTNLLLTGLVSRMAAFPQPLLRSFLLNVNLVFQPSVKSLVQVLSSVRQKVDNCAVTTGNFGGLIQRARMNLRHREHSLLFPSAHASHPSAADYLSPKPRAATVSDVPSAEKKKMSLTDLLFRRTPKQQRQGGGPGQQLQRVAVTGGVGYRFVNSLGVGVGGPPRHSTSTLQPGGVGGQGPDMKTWNAVYCALVLEEFLKELAALSLEHSVLWCDEGYCSS